MADDRVSVEYALIDNMSRELARIRQNVERTSATIETSGRAGARQFNAMKIAAVGFGAVLAGVVARGAFKAATGYETLTTQFSTLLKSTDAATARMKELAKFAETTPFQLKEVAAASRVLETLTKGALSTGDGLRLVGDAAAATGSDFQNLAMHIGRAYDGLQSNRPVGEAMMRLQELGIVAGDARNQIETLQKAGRGKEAWKLLQTELKKTEGGMKALSQTTTGMISTFKDLLDAGFRQALNEGLFENTKDGIEDINEAMRRLLEEGAFARVGAVIGGALNTITGFFGVLGTGIAMLPSTIAEAFFKIQASWNGLWGAIIPGSKKHFKTLQEDALQNAEFQKKINDIISEESVDSYEALTGGISQMWKGITGDIKLAGDEADKVAKKTGTKDTGKTPRAAAVDTAAIEAAKAQAEAIKSIQREHSLIQLDEIDRASTEQLQALYDWQGERLVAIGEDQDAQLLLEALFQSKVTEIDEEAALKRRDIADRLAKHEENLRLSRIQDTADMFGALSNLVKASGKENKAAAILSQSLAIAQAGVNTGLAISASAAIGFPQAIPGVIAAIANGAASVAMIASQSFANGGIVKGPSTGDTVGIRANGGEMMLNGPQQTTLFDAIDKGRINGGGGTMNVTIGSITSENKDEVIQEFANTYNDAKFAGVL